MQIVQKFKRFLSILLIFGLVFGLLAGLSTCAQAAEILPEELYIEQSRSGVCTLASATMLIRARMYLSGSEHWSEVTEQAVRASVWLEGVGILFDWTYTIAGATLTGGRTELHGVTADELKALLDAHPEGIEFYCQGVPHAVFLTDYEGDTFYCADPAPYCSGQRIPLADSWLGYRLGSQENILRNATAYWAIEEYSIESDVAVTPEEALKAEEVAAATDLKRLAQAEKMLTA